jgi:hypothetical protein
MDVPRVTVLSLCARFDLTRHVRERLHRQVVERPRADCGSHVGKSEAASRHLHVNVGAGAGHGVAIEVEPNASTRRDWSQPIDDGVGQAIADM